MILQPVCMKADIYCLKIVRITYFQRILLIVSHSDLYLQNLKGSPNLLLEIWDNNVQFGQTERVGMTWPTFDFSGPIRV